MIIHFFHLHHVFLSLFLSAIADQIARLSYLDSPTDVCDQVCDEYEALLSEMNTMQAALRPASAVKRPVTAPAPSQVRSLLLLPLLPHSLHLIDDVVHLSGYRRRGENAH